MSEERADMQSRVQSQGRHAHSFGERELKHSRQGRGLLRRRLIAPDVAENARNHDERRAHPDQGLTLGLDQMALATMGGEIER